MAHTTLLSGFYEPSDLSDSSDSSNGLQKREERPDTDVSDLSSQKDGGYLLSLRTSTIGAIGLNFSVRNGKRWIPNAITT